MVNQQFLSYKDLFALLKVNCDGYWIIFLREWISIIIILQYNYGNIIIVWLYFSLKSGSSWIWTKFGDSLLIDWSLFPLLQLLHYHSLQYDFICELVMQQNCIVLGCPLGHIQYSTVSLFRLAIFKIPSSFEKFFCRRMKKFFDKSSHLVPRKNNKILFIAGGTSNMVLPLYFSE